MNQKLALLQSNKSDEDLKAEIDEYEDCRIRVLMDGTYFFMESPGEVELMKETYDLGKSKFLTKAHIHCTTNGYILDVSNRILALHFYFFLEFRPLEV